MGKAKRGAAGTIASARQLGKAIGKSHETAAKWVRHPQWVFGAGPWRAVQVPAMLAWANKFLAPDPARANGGDAQRERPLTLLQKANLAKKVEDAKTTKVKREILEKQFHSIAACEQLTAQKIRVIRDNLLSLAHRLPNVTDEQKQWLELEIEQMLNGFAGVN